MYPVTSHMSGLTKNISPTSSPSIISLGSIVSPTIDYMRCSLSNYKNTEKKNNHFRMHDSHINYYVKEYEDSLLVKKFTGKKESYSKQQIKDAKETRELYASLGYPSFKDYKWVM